MKRLNRRRFIALATAGAAGGILTACGNNPDATNLSPTRIPDVAGAPTLAANATPPSGEAASTGGGGEQLTTVDLKTIDLAFEPKDWAIPADTDVTVNMTNAGALNHDFAMEQPKPFTSEVISGGGSTTFKLNLPAGTYEYWCSEPGHKEAGMVGTITVGGAAEAPATEEQAAPAGNAATEVSVDTVELAFQPKELTIAANTDAKITITNKGVLQHDFHVDQLDITSKMLNPGDTDTVTINAAPGTYQFWCTVPGHKEAGMTGTLTVVAAGAGGATSKEASPQTSSEKATPADGATPAAGKSGGGATTASVNTVDINFEPKELTIAANTDVTITVTNKGVLQHDFHVDQLDITSKLLNAGETDTVTINAAPGTYEFWCTVPGHKEAGMTGKLTIQ